MLVLNVGGVSCKQVAFHQGDTDAQEEQQYGDWTRNGPPEVWISQRNKEIQSPPEEHFTKVVWMARSRPQSRWNRLLCRSWLAQKPPHLQICCPFDDHGSQRHQRSHAIQPAQVGIAVAQGRPQCQASQKDQESGHQVNPKKANRPIKETCLFTDILVAPIFVAQPTPLGSPAGCQTDRPQTEVPEDEEMARVGEPII